MEKITKILLIILHVLLAVTIWIALRKTEHGLEIAGWALLLILVLMFNFTTLPTGNIKFIDVMESYTKTISGQGIFGFHWVGVRYLYRVHKFKVKKERENPSGSGPEQWIQSGEVTEVDSLLKIIPRPFVLREVELGDRTQIDILVTVLLEAKDGKKFVYELKADFLKIGAAIRTAVADEVKKFPNLTAFIAADKSETSGFLRHLGEPGSMFNQRLLSYSDLELITIEIPQYNADKSMLEAANQEAIAKLKGLADIAAAEAYAQALQTKTQADAERAKQLASAPVNGVLEALETAGATPEEKILALQEIIKWGAVQNSHLTALVEKGGGSMPTFSIR